MQSIMKPRFVGKRFEHHSLPLDVLNELSVLKDVLYEAARLSYYQKHDKQRVPRGYFNDLSLHLCQISEGSAIVEIGVDINTLQPELFSTTPECLSDGINYFYDALAHANDESLANSGIPKSFLGKCAKLGRCLQSDESIEFISTDAQKIYVNHETRKSLWLASSDETLSERKHLTGVVTECDGKNRRFTLQLLSGDCIQGELPSAFDEDIAEYVKQYISGQPQLVRIDCTANYNRLNKLSSFDNVEKMDELDPLDVHAALEKILFLKKGWLEGVGDAFDPDRIMRLDGLFSKYYQYPQLPYTYPDEEQTIIWEWDIGMHSISLMVHLNDWTAEWCDYHKQNKTSIDKEFSDITTESFWMDVQNMLKEVESC